MKALHVLKETFISSLPLAAIIIIVCVFIAPMQNTDDYLKLAVGYTGVVVGQAVCKRQIGKHKKTSRCAGRQTMAVLYKDSPIRFTV